jgi:hypothetical protein
MLPARGTRSAQRLVILRETGMSEQLIIEKAHVSDLVAAVESLGAEVETQDFGDARMLTCRRGKATININISTPSDWRAMPYARDHAVAVVMVGSLFHRREAGELRAEVMAACAPLVVELNDFLEQARAAAGPAADPQGAARPDSE